MTESPYFIGSSIIEPDDDEEAKMVCAQIGHLHYKDRRRIEVIIKGWREDAND